jgi:hypothetical protein
VNTQFPIYRVKKLEANFLTSAQINEPFAGQFNLRMGEPFVASPWASH